MDEQHHDHHDHSHLPEMEVRVRALQSLMEAKGFVDPGSLDALVALYENEVGPQNGARVVARAWTDPAYAERLFSDPTQAIAELGYGGRAGEHMVALKNTAAEHHMVVCTLCSCYPWSVLGLPPVWYKSPAYRAKAVADPRGVLADFGVSLADDVAVTVSDSTAEVRYLVVPMRPAGTEGWSEEALAAIVGRDAMIGTGLPGAKASR